MNRLRPELIAGPHPVEAGVWLVYDPASGRQLEIPEEGWRLAEAFDGRSVSAIAADVGLSEAVVTGFSEQLGALGFWEQGDAPSSAPSDGETWSPQWTRAPLDAGFEIAVHPDASFTCTGAGTCCEQGYVIPLTPPQAASVRRAGLRVLGAGVDPVGLVPTSHGQPWTFALDNERSCPFLDAAKRCRIHERAAYPDACRIFPLVFAQWDGTVFVSVAHRCACGAFGGAPLSSQRASLASRARRSGRVYTVPARTRVDRTQEIPSADAVVALHTATSEASAFGILRAAVSGLAAAAPSSRGRRIVGDRELAGVLDALTSDDVYVAAALAGGVHPRRREVRRAVRRLVGDANEIHAPRRGPSRRAGAPIGDAKEIRARRGRSSRRSGADVRDANEFRSPSELAHLEATRFVRDHLFGLRPYHYATLAEGLAALTLAAHRILTDLPRRDPHIAARERVMLWEEALTTNALPRLMASSDAHDLGRIAALVEALEPA